MPSVSFFFGVTLAGVNLCLHTFTHMTVTLRGVGGRGLFQKKLYLLKNVLLCQKKSWKDLKRSIRVLKYINGISVYFV